ncbi:hypothetical protein C5D98_15100 [Rathayibacter rathayi]|uniref:hypothetical protein n=1 Tax=Rathayibacter rathayi TaxID=33887 RepID=UPI000CE8A615|nr:hypothetical protein [Rathayibacter rathayi]PPG77508.1 hypothetical protein C5C15_09445 [Rathayibacter rathayi]PPG94344.1 hypothetical protein C5C22_09180 [Rathayibacter rathayi]PPI65276.1 hypothetical protein C5D98_15100 [Rathayibacter rathayi]
MSEEPERKSGRKSFGERFVVSSRPPVDDKAAWQRHADELGVSLGNFVILTVNAALGLEIPDFVQEELDKAEALRNQPKLEGLRMQRAS